MLNEKDISNYFNEIELELIKSMRRNLKHHLNEEKKENINFTQWQSEMLKGLDDYLKENKKRLPSYYRQINKEIEDMIKTEYKTGATKQEKEILEAILNGAKVKPSKSLQKKLKSVKGGTLEDKARTILETEGSFFKVNDRAVNSLIDECLNPLKKGEAAILRQTADIYRDIVFKAQVKAQVGSKPLYKAVDEAATDFLNQGITYIKYSDGKKVNIQSYSEMAIRTAKKRAFLTGEGEMRKEWGISLVLTSQYGSSSPTCYPFQNKVCIDDVFSGGKPDGVHPLLSDFMKGGFYHPNCRHTHSSYFPSITSKRKDLDEAETSEHYRLEQEQRKNERNIRRYKRLEAGTLDPLKKKDYAFLKNMWEEKNLKLINDNPKILRRDEWRESSQFEKFLAAPTPTAPKAPTPAATPKKPITDRLKDKNIIITGHFGGITEEVKNNILNYIDDLTNRFKVNYHLKKHKLEMKTRTIKSCAMYVHNPKLFTVNEFVFSKNHFTDIKKLEETQKRMELSNFWMKCDEDKRKDYVITHEFGHYIEAVLHSKSSLSYRDFNLSMMNRIKDLYRKEYKEEINISRYGKTDPAEFFAEAFAESVLYKDSKIKKVMNQILKDEGLL